jgi:hypothetical protein
MTIKKKKIIALLPLGAGIVIATYIGFTVQSFVVCPSTCIAMGGAMWGISYFSKDKNNNKDQNKNLV